MIRLERKEEEKKTEENKTHEPSQRLKLTQILVVIKSRRGEHDATKHDEHRAKQQNAFHRVVIHEPLCQFLSTRHARHFQLCHRRPTDRP